MGGCHPRTLFIAGVLGEAITKGSLSQLPLFRNETERGGKGGRGATYPRRLDAAVMTLLGFALGWHRGALSSPSGGCNMISAIEGGAPTRPRSLAILPSSANVKI